MSPHTHDDIGEGDLHDYVDGKLTAERQRKVEDWLKDNPAAAEKVATWQAKKLDQHTQKATQHTDNAAQDTSGMAQTSNRADIPDGPETLDGSDAEDSDEYLPGFDNNDRQENQQDTQDTHPHENSKHNESHRPNHRDDLTRNLRHPPHLGRRMPAAPTFFADEPDSGTRRGRYGLRQMAAILMVFIAGGLGGAAIVEATLPDTPARPDFIDALPAISGTGYDIYANDQNHPVEINADQKDHLLSWLGERVGISLSVPNLSSQGFHLLGGRLVLFGDHPGALLMYENNDGQRLTLTVAHNPDNISADFSTQSHGKIETFYWIDGPVGYAVSSTNNTENLRNAALAVYRQTGG